MSLGVIATLFTISWYRKKIFQQFIRLPFNQSLMDCEINIQEHDLEVDAYHFLDKLKNSLTGPDHVILYGPKGGNKTSICVGLALEMGLRQYRCSYHTMNSLIAEFDISNDSLEKKSFVRWSWRRADLIIIDDLLTLSDGSSEFVVSPSDFTRLVNQRYPGVESNISPFFDHKTIWILDTDSDQQVRDWISCLRQLMPTRTIKRIKLI
jgi:DNA replication protein DnaC